MYYTRRCHEASKHHCALLSLVTAMTREEEAGEICRKLRDDFLASGFSTKRDRIALKYICVSLCHFSQRSVWYTCQSVRRHLSGKQNDLSDNAAMPLPLRYE
jgi:hypothetical protein